MKYNEETYKKEVTEKYNGEIEIVGKFKGISFPILCKDKYGVMQLGTARQLLNFRPGIKAALNKTQYFMNQLKEIQPQIAEKLAPASEYVKAKEKMLFTNKFGIVSATPDNLLHGHDPNIRSAINRKEYFKNQLLFLYDNKYDFIIDSTSRHKGRVTLVCPIHGNQSVDSDSIFLGTGCPCCNKGWEKSDTFYLIKLYDENESFYKLGISYKLKNGDIRRFREYRTLNYNIDVLYIKTFNDAVECKEFETKLKKIIRNNLYVPKRWEYNTSTETFTNELLPTIKENLIYDIVSTSDENQSSVNNTDID